MANERELFTILEDKTTAGRGVPLPAKQAGDTVADNQVAVLAAKTSDGKEAKIPLTSDNRVAVSMAAPGTPLRDSDSATPSTINTDTDVAVITLTASAKYCAKAFRGSSNQPTNWKLVHDNNGVDDELACWDTGPGHYGDGSPGEMTSLIFTAGATGTQECKIVGSQERGPVSDMLAWLVIEEAP